MKYFLKYFKTAAASFVIASLVQVTYVHAEENVVQTEENTTIEEEMQQTEMAEFGIAFAESSVLEVSAGDEDALIAAIAGANNSDTTVITVTGNITLLSVITIDGKDITIKSDGTATIKSMAALRHFDVMNNSNLTLENIKLEGNDTTVGGGIKIKDSTLTVGDGATITKCYVHTANSGNNKGGGIYASNDSIINLSGTADISSNSAYKGAGVYLDSGASLIIDGETKIHNNLVGYAVSANDTNTKVTLISGDIYENKGGIEGINSTVTIEGGMIRDNTLDEGLLYGAGIHVRSGELNIMGGEISGNKVAGWGGGICVYDSTSTLNISGGKISGNEAGYGGGVYIFLATMDMSGGEISGNKTKYSGGGIFLNFSGDNGKMKVRGNAIISGNVADRDGGGIASLLDHAYTQKPIEMPIEISSGEISDNTATRDGGGIFAEPTYVKLTGDPSEIIFSGNTAQKYVVPFNPDTDYDEYYTGYTNYRNDMGEQLFNNLDIYYTGTEQTSQHNVEFDYNDGVRGIIHTENVNPGELLAQPEQPTRTGYNFIHWNTSSDGTGMAWEFETEPVTEEVILYAQWELIIVPVQYTVTFEVNGGSAVTPKTVALNTLLVENDLATTRTGYTFGGWYKEIGLINKWDFATDKVVDNITLYPKWTVKTVPNQVPVPDQYTVTFNMNGLTLVSTPSNQTKLLNEKVSAPTIDLETDSYVITGFNYNGSAWNFDNDSVSQSMELVAQWKAKYAVTFDTDGGSAVANQTKLLDETVDRPANPTKIGNSFVNWTLSDGTEYNFGSLIKGDLDLYANWKTDKINVPPVVKVIPPVVTTADTVVTTVAPPVVKKIDDMTVEASPIATVPVAQKEVNYRTQQNTNNPEEYFVFDEDGAPLGSVTVPEGKTIDDIDIGDELMPLGTVKKENPKTGDTNYTLFITTTIYSLIVLVYVQRKLKKA